MTTALNTPQRDFLARATFYIIFYYVIIAFAFHVWAGGGHRYLPFSHPACGGAQAFFLIFHGNFYFSSSGQAGGRRRLSLLPPGACRYFYRAEGSAVSFLVDLHRLKRHTAVRIGCMAVCAPLAPTPLIAEI